jgi:SAM-dependent methyltransferase
MPAISRAVNYWPNNKCARLFWAQHEWPPYQKLLADTVAWLEPQPGQRWLDLGCGGGQLTKALWLASGGQLKQVIGLDCAAANAKAYANLRVELAPEPPERIRFIAANFSKGVPFDGANLFDGVVSGLAIQYADDYSPELGRWTTAAYDRVLREVWRVLKPGGRFVFSVNTPNPSWIKIALLSFPGFLTARRPLRYFQKSWALFRFGGWLKDEAKRGRFHYLPRTAVVTKLRKAGFADVQRRRSFAGQAYIFRCHKPG